MAIKCPYCGRRIVTQSRSTVFESSARTPLRHSSGQALKNAAAAIPPPPLPTISNPVGLPSMESHVHVPVNQGLISGCLWGPVVVLTVSSMARYWTTTGEAVVIGLVIGGIAFFTVAALRWEAKTKFYDSLLLQKAETYFGLDLDGDGAVGPPQLVQVEVKSEDGNRWQFADLPGKPAALRDFAGRVLMGQGFTDETGAMAGLTQKEVKDLREAFVSRGWAGWKHPNRKQQGIELRHVGKSVLRAIAGAEVAGETQP